MGVEWALAGLVISAIAMIASASISSSSAQKTNESNQNISEQNIAFQQEENEITREREDNAVQRRKADLIAAGMSPVLAAGNPASAQALSSPTSTYGGPTHLLDSFSDMLSSAPTLGLDMIQKYSQMNNNNEMVKAQVQNIRANTLSTLFDNTFKQGSLQDRLDFQKYATSMKKADSEGYSEYVKSIRDFQNARLLGLNNENSLFSMRKEILEAQRNIIEDQDFMSFQNVDYFVNNGRERGGAGQFGNIYDLLRGIFDSFAFKGTDAIPKTWNLYREWQKNNNRRWFHD